MAAACEVDDANKAAMYRFRFDSSDKLVQLTQQQLDCIPYLTAVVAHKDDFSSIQNKNGEYVLSYPIEYIWFLAILRSVTSGNPYILFNELPEDNNILNTLQLFDYLNVNSFSLPLLKDENLVRSNPTSIESQKNCIKYHNANLLEARQTAAEFIIALSKNEYKLCDSHTVKRIFFLIRVILSNATVFSARFRSHTLAVVKECCYYFFSKKQQHLLPTTQQITQYSKTDSFMYLYDDVQLSPDDFQNTFSWRGVYVPVKENQTNPLSATAKKTFEGGDDHLSIEEDRLEFFPEIVTETSFFGPTFVNLYSNWYTRIRIAQLVEWILEYRSSTESRESLGENLPIYEIKQDRRKDKAQFARSGHFNTLPKRPAIDKFKHRCESKAQKYR